MYIYVQVHIHTYLLMYFYTYIQVDAEYQFDKHKLILYYSASRRIDFREFVRDLFAIYKTRIWMEQATAHHFFRPSETAARALATGICLYIYM
jgi:cell fate regulator YaaT (PSP1 superfamily)